MAPGGADAAQDLKEVTRRDVVVETVGGGNGGLASTASGKGGSVARAADIQDTQGRAVSDADVAVSDTGLGFS
jgi:hypothetical protein